MSGGADSGSLSRQLKFPRYSSEPTIIVQLKNLNCEPHLLLPPELSQVEIQRFIHMSLGLFMSYCSPQVFHTKALGSAVLLPGLGGARRCPPAQSGGVHPALRAALQARGPTELPGKLACL